MQISQQLSIFGQSINLRQALLVGGVSYKKQLVSLEDYPHIVIGTPGRLNEMIGKSENFKNDIQRAEIMILDEADRLFEETLLPSMREIMENMPDIKQIILATATVDDNF